MNIVYGGEGDPNQNCLRTFFMLECEYFQKVGRAGGRGPKSKQFEKTFVGLNFEKKFHRRCIQKIWTKSKLEQFFSQLVQLFCNFTGLNRKKIEKVSFGKHLCVFNCFTVINQLSLSFTISKIIPVRAVLPPYKPVMSSTVNSLLFKGNSAVNTNQCFINKTLGPP